MQIQGGRIPFTSDFAKKKVKKFLVFLGVLTIVLSDKTTSFFLKIFFKIYFCDAIISLILKVKC